VKTKKVVINVCFGGFGLSDEAYEWLIAYGVKVQKYHEQERGKNGRYMDQPLNDGEVIFDRGLTPMGEDSLNDLYYKSVGRSSMSSRYWECWTDKKREHPLVVKCVKELGTKADGRCAELKIVSIPADVDYEIDEHDGWEHIAEVHRTWE